MKIKLYATLLASLILGIAANTFAAGPGGGMGGGSGGMGSMGKQGMGPGQGMGSGQGQTQMDQIRERQRDQKQIEQRVRQYPDVYGAQLMTNREVSRYRERIRTAATQQERNQIMERHRSQMDARAKRMGVKVTTNADLERARDRTRDQDRDQTRDQDRDRTRDQ